jgi:translin
VDLSPLSEKVQRRFELKSAAREQALGAARRAIRSSANAIRAIHRRELDEAHRLMEEARAALEAGRRAVREAHPDVYFAGFLQDAQKEYAEARLTEAVIMDGALPDPDELEVEIPAFLNGMAEAIGEGRRAVLDLLRRGEFERGERILRAMDDLYYVLVSIDYPDAVTGNLRRSTDVARSILEKTRGDLSVSLVQRELREALERHAERFSQQRDERLGPG